MHMTQSELKARRDNLIELLEIVSLGGRYYLARFFIDGDCYLLTDDHDEPIWFSGACVARDAFQHHDVAEAMVLQPTAVDEMIGLQQPGEPESVRIPL